MISFLFNCYFNYLLSAVYSDMRSCNFSSVPICTTVSSLWHLGHSISSSLPSLLFKSCFPQFGQQIIYFSCFLIIHTFPLFEISRICDIMFNLICRNSKLHQYHHSRSLITFMATPCMMQLSMNMSSISGFSGCSLILLLALSI